MRLSILMVVFMTAMTVSAQQTVFNVPTADVMDKGKVYVELDASFKTNNDVYKFAVDEVGASHSAYRTRV